MVVGGRVWVCGLITPGVCIKICGSYFQRPCNCLVSRLTPGTMMLLLAMFGSVVLPQLGSVSMSVAYVITGAYANHVSRCEGSVELPMPHRTWVICFLHRHGRPDSAPCLRGVVSQTNSDTTQTHIQGFELALSNIYPIYMTC